MSRFTAEGAGLPAFVAARSRYRDTHETSLTLIVLGIAIAASAASEHIWSGGAWVYDWRMAVALTLAFAVLWLTFRRRANSQGKRGPPGFGIAAIICLAANLPPFFVVLIYAGPFISFGVALAVAGLKLQNRVLTYCALTIGSIGVFEGFFGLSNRLPLRIWAGWEHLAIYLMLGAITCLGGVIIRIRESVAATPRNTG